MFVQRFWVVIVCRTTSGPSVAHANEIKGAIKDKSEVDEERVVHRTSRVFNVQTRVIISTTPLLDVREMNAKPRGPAWAAELAIGPLSKSEATEYTRLLKSVKGLQTKAKMAIHIGLVLAKLDNFDQSDDWMRLLFLNHEGILIKSC